MITVQLYSPLGQRHVNLICRVFRSMNEPGFFCSVIHHPTFGRLAFFIVTGLIWYGLMTIHQVDEVQP